MHYLITGGAGFIGSHLADTLLFNGHGVTVIDDLSTGSMANIAHLEHRKGFHYVIDTILNRPLLSELVEECDVIFHLAAAVGVKLIIESPVRAIETNIKGTEAVLECANRKKRKTLIASTSEVYGKSTKIPFSEDDDILLGPTLKDRWGYACSKAMDEFLALAYWKENHLPVVICRFFNTTGPRQTGRYGMVLPRFVHQALRSAPITVHGDGTQSRTFTHVKDTVAALVRLAEHPEAVGEVFNIGGDEEVTIIELAKMVKDMTRSSSEIHFVSYEDAYDNGFEDVRRRVPELTKIRRLLQIGRPLGIEVIVRDMIAYFSELGSPDRLAV
jgi:UDP-glucose 4-epimerase